MPPFFQAPIIEQVDQALADEIRVHLRPLVSHTWRGEGWPVTKTTRPAESGVNAVMSLLPSQAFYGICRDAGLPTIAGKEFIREGQGGMSVQAEKHIGLCVLMGPILQQQLQAHGFDPRTDFALQMSAPSSSGDDGGCLTVVHNTLGYSRALGRFSVEQIDVMHLAMLNIRAVASGLPMFAELPRSSKMGDASNQVRAQDEAESAKADDCENTDPAQARPCN